MSNETTPSPTYKASLADIKDGDMVITDRWSGDDRFALRKVERVTKTTIILGKDYPIAYQRSTGKAVKRRFSNLLVYAPLEISHTDRETGQPITVLAKMQAHAAKVAADIKRYRDVQRVRAEAERLTAAELQQIVAMLDTHQAAIDEIALQRQATLEAELTAMGL